VHNIDPLSVLGPDLASVQNPARYLGGEYGQIVKASAPLTVALAFPDLYEIAMSNLAIKILYDGMNRLEKVRCERVFAPAPDFEEVLKRRQVPLYTLESGIPVRECDILAVSIGYEPGITGLLSILDTAGIPFLRADRGADDPIVIAGGCGVTNPAPFSNILDAVFIGEAEAGLFDLLAELALMRENGVGRDGLLERLESHPSIWTANKPRAKRAVFSGFGGEGDRQVCFPVPHMRVVQDHGSVEIMRGCPNGCRFCHAGVNYRPQRMKSRERVLEDVAFLVNEGGYREISLMSLSSGDYEGIDGLLDSLTAEWAGKHVSFQLPSLKVNTFTLPLLERMAEVRKGGLTLAIETPVDGWQRSLNKEVYRDRILDILTEAKRRGWNKVKFYFMIGLPVESEGSREEEEIVRFLLDIQERTRMQCNANIGTFIPKPHTPYQWARQLSSEEADRKLSYIHGALPKGRFKVSTHRPFNSFLEAMITRGDERVGDLAIEAYRRGCRLDAWEDWAKPEVWKEVIAGASWDVEAETIRERSRDEVLPWDGVSVGVSKSWLWREKERSDAQTLTAACDTDCEDRCGVCGKTVKVVKPTPPEKESVTAEKPREEAFVPGKSRGKEATHRVLLSFSKTKEAPWVPHLGLLEIWHKAFQRSALPVIFTEGFNPLPRFELAQSMSVGVSSKDEIASFLLSEPVDPAVIEAALKKSLPANIGVNRVFAYPLSTRLRRESLSKYLWGNRYRYRIREEGRGFSALLGLASAYAQGIPGASVEADAHDPFLWSVTMPFRADRPFRDMLETETALPLYRVAEITKLEALAVPGNDDDETPTDFFSVFGEVAKANEAAL